jgi:hypothetical protein
LEVYNGYPTSVNLKNFKIADVNNVPVDLVTANSVIVPSGGLALLAHNAAIWGTNQNNCWDDNGAVTANLGGQLDIDTGVLKLLDANNQVVDRVDWGDPPLDPVQNESIQRTPVNGWDTAFGDAFNAGDFEVLAVPEPGL